jgi:hypothetical protein
MVYEENIPEYKRSANLILIKMTNLELPLSKILFAYFISYKNSFILSVLKTLKV